MIRLLAVALAVAAPSASAPVTAQPANTATAILASGCFWCTEHDLELVPGVIAVDSGYTGGRVRNPAYEEVSAGGTGHYEAVRVTYDPARLSYARLLDAFWKTVDPFDATGQFCDKGPQYRAAIFPATSVETAIAESSKKAVAAKLKATIVTAIVPASRFWPAEDYHQDYAKKNPVRYKYYRFSCGRDARLKDVWGK